MVRIRDGEGKQKVLSFGGLRKNLGRLEFRKEQAFAKGGGISNGMDKASEGGQPVNADVTTAKRVLLLCRGPTRCRRPLVRGLAQGKTKYPGQCSLES